MNVLTSVTPSLIFIALCSFGHIFFPSVKLFELFFYAYLFSFVHRFTSNLYCMFDVVGLVNLVVVVVVLFYYLKG